MENIATIANECTLLSVCVAKDFVLPLSTTEKVSGYTPD